MRWIKLIAVSLSLLFHAMSRAELLDAIYFGNRESEAAHHLTETRSRIINGGLDETARELLPLEPVSFDGGRVGFTVKVDPKLPIYFTIKLWGDDRGEDRGRLLLFCEGKQVGYRHIGDVDDLDILSNQPRFPGRFSYITTILPRAMTAGKESVNVEIRALGRIWGYGETWEKFQKNIEQPSRGIYRAYAHTQTMFVPPSQEKQGSLSSPTVRSTPGPEVIDRVKKRVNDAIDKLLSASRLTQMEMQFLARAYHVKWTHAYHQEKVVARLVDALDQVFVSYRANPRLAESDPETWNADWFGLGPSGDVIRLLADKITPVVDEKIVGMDGTVTRREGWTEMLVVCRDWHRQHRRQYTNQSMINDLYGIYLANRGVAVLSPKKAMSEDEARRYLCESVGLQPWLGNDTPNGPTKPLGENYMQLTEKYLTKELGYVGSYGEVLDWATAIYNATRPTLDADGDPRIKKQLEKIAQARAVFRYPLPDAENHRAMVLETNIGWRDSHYPGDVTYAQRTTWDSGPLETATATLEPHLVGYAQQMIEDNQFFKAMEERLVDKGFRVTAGLLNTPESYEVILAQPSSRHRLPMTASQPDFVFADEQNGVVAIKNGDEILYASLYWRARFGVNSLARVHFLAPTMERDATIWEEVKFDDSGMTTARDDRVMEAQTRRHEKSRGDLRQALEGEILPIAKIPAGVPFKPGQENVYAGKGTFYVCRYGDYLIAMNCTKDRTFDLAVPDEFSRSRELVSQKELQTGTRSIGVAPWSSLVLRRIGQSAP